MPVPVEPAPPPPGRVIRPDVPQWKPRYSKPDPKNEKRYSVGPNHFKLFSRIGRLNPLAVFGAALLSPTATADGELPADIDAELRMLREIEKAGEGPRLEFSEVTPKSVEVVYQPNEWVAPAPVYVPELPEIRPEELPEVDPEAYPLSVGRIDGQGVLNLRPEAVTRPQAVLDLQVEPEGRVRARLRVKKRLALNPRPAERFIPRGRERKVQKLPVAAVIVLQAASQVTEFLDFLEVFVWNLVDAQGRPAMVLEGGSRLKAIQGYIEGTYSLDIVAFTVDFLVMQATDYAIGKMARSAQKFANEWVDRPVGWLAGPAL